MAARLTRWPPAPTPLAPSVAARLTRRRFLAAALAVPAAGALPACGDPEAAHPALRRPRSEGIVALLTATGSPDAVRADADLLRRAAASDAVLIGIGTPFLVAAGLTDRAPTGLAPMPPFPGDVLDPARTNPAVLVQFEGDSPAALTRQADSLLDDLTALRVTWRTPVNRSPLDPRDGKPLQRNTFGFDEGHANPPDSIVVTDAPPWAIGGSYLAVRVIRLAHDLWSADPPEKQRRIIGRHPDGRWLDGTDALATPAFHADPDGATTPLDSHVRHMNPRTPDSPPPVMLRRSWSYRGGTLPGGHPDEGMVFMAFQRDLTTGFVRAQQRLPGDALAPYLLTTGGGYFLSPTPTGLATLLTP